MKKRSVMHKYAARRLNPAPLSGLTHRSFLCASLIVALTAGCEEKKPQEQPTKAATPPAMPVPSAAPPAPVPAPAPVVEAKPKKKLEDCPKDVTIENSELEASIRVKAQKAEGAITKADLKKLRSLNLARVALDDLDVCLFHHMTELRELFLPPSGIADLSPIAGAK